MYLTKENAINIFNALDEFGVPFKIEPDDFLAPNSVLQIGIEPNRIDILSPIKRTRTIKVNN